MPKKIGMILILLAMGCGILVAQQALDNDAVIKMVKAGLSEDVIVAAVTSQPGSYQLDADHLIALKTAGVPDKVMAAMVTKNSGLATAPAVSTTTATVAKPLVDEIGVYFKKNDQWTELAPEVINWKTGGFGKTLASGGWVKPDLNGHIAGGHSKNVVTTPLEFLIYVPEGVAITEYQLLHLHDHSDSREFRSVTGGVVHSSSGAQRDEVPFEGKKIAPRMYDILLPTGFGKGEYGFLPPGAMSSSNMASSGKMYTFQILE
jgi:hypothetical protein